MERVILVNCLKRKEYFLETFKMAEQLVQVDEGLLCTSGPHVKAFQNKHHQPQCCDNALLLKLTWGKKHIVHAIVSHCLIS